MQKFLSKIREQINKIHNFFQINPHKHWKFVVSVFFVFVFVLVLFSLYLLYEIKNDQIFQVKKEQQETKTLLKESLLKNTIREFEIKAKEETDIKNGIYTYSDPSL